MLRRRFRKWMGVCVAAAILGCGGGGGTEGTPVPPTPEAGAAQPTRSAMPPEEAAYEERGGRMEAPPASTEAPAASTEAPAAAPAKGPSKSGLELTRIERKNGTYTLTFNGVLTVPNVRVQEGRNGAFLAFPRRRSGDQYYNYFYLDRAEGDRLLAAVRAGRATAESAEPLKVTNVEVRRLTGSGKTRAFVTFEFNGGALTSSSWKLIEGRDGLWLAPPSERKGDEWVDVAEATYDFKQTLEEKAVAAYKEAEP